MATSQQSRPLTRDKLSQIVGGNHEAIRFLETLFGDSTNLFAQVAQALQDAENARFRAERAIADAMSARKKAESSLTPSEVMAIVARMTRPDRRMPRWDDANFVLASRTFGRR